MQYDADGNLTDDGRWRYEYNAKNQLVSVCTSDTASYAPKTKYLYAYDYLGRRVRTTSYTWSSVGNVWVDPVVERYIYNGWNLVAVLNSSNGVVRSFVWGLDLSGTPQGAGGVGGLLMVQEGANRYLPVYDTNGNVHGLITTTSVTLGGTAYAAGSLVAAYEFDAFGNTLRQSGPLAASNPFRFSTKYTDTETSLVYYGLRYYSPTLGRFINQDPISESGGLNLYGFVGNNGVNRWDYLGMVPQDQYFAAPGDDEFDRQMQVIWGNRVDLVGMMDGLRSMQSFNTGWNDRAAAENASGGSGSPDVISVIAGILTGKGSGTSGGSASPSTSGTGTGGTGGSVLGDGLRNIPLLGRVLGGAGDIVSGVLGTAAGVVTLGHSGSLGSGLGNIGHGLGGVAMGGLDLAGKAWNAPNTAIGLIAGIGSVLMGGDLPTISRERNAIEFTNSRYDRDGAITLGNVIIYGSRLGPETEAPEGGHSTGAHETQHTRQGQMLGPLYLPLHGINLLVGQLTGDHHGAANLLERGPQMNPPQPWPWRGN